MDIKFLKPQPGYMREYVDYGSVEWIEKNHNLRKINDAVMLERNTLHHAVAMFLGAEEGIDPHIDGETGDGYGYYLFPGYKKIYAYDWRPSTDELQMNKLWDFLVLRLKDGLHLTHSSWNRSGEVRDNIKILHDQRAVAEFFGPCTGRGLALCSLIAETDWSNYLNKGEER